MTVESLLDKGFNAIVLADKDRVVNGVYVGDLLSWVMSSAQADNAWITIMSNINVLAVAGLTDVACVILAEGVTLEEDVVAQAKLKGINVISTDKTAYETAVTLSELGL